MILALDTSVSRTGWCLGDPAGPVRTGSARFTSPAFQVMSAKGQRQTRMDLGNLAIEFSGWLNGMCDRHDVTAITFEQPVAHVAKLNLNTIRALYGLTWTTEHIAAERRLPCWEANTSTMKKMIYGNGRVEKRACVSLARRWGFDVDTHDEADACGVWLLAVNRKYPEHFAAWQKRLDDSLVGRGERLV